MGLKRYSFPCCIACKQTVLCEGLSVFAAFFLQFFLIMDPLTAKIWKERAENKWLIFPITFYFQSFTDSAAFSDFCLLQSPASPRKNKNPKLDLILEWQYFPCMEAVSR